MVYMVARLQHHEEEVSPLSTVHLRYTGHMLATTMWQYVPFPNMQVFRWQQ